VEELSKRFRGSLQGTPLELQLKFFLKQNGMASRFAAHRVNLCSVKVCSSLHRLGYRGANETRQVRRPCSDAKLRGRERSGLSIDFHAPHGFLISPTGCCVSPVLAPHCPENVGFNKYRHFHMDPITKTNSTAHLYPQQSRYTRAGRVVQGVPMLWFVVRRASCPLRQSTALATPFKKDTDVIVPWYEDTDSGFSGRQPPPIL